MMFFCITANFDLSGDECPPQPPPTGPGGDNPDENRSFAVSIPNPIESFPANSEIYILDTGFYKEATSLMVPFTQKISILKNKNSYADLLSEKSILMIPSSGFFEKENDSILKNLLVEFVKGGGILIVFAQQYGAHIENVVPITEGESLKTYGWREDQSCLRFSAYFDIGSIFKMHGKFGILTPIDVFILDSVHVAYAVIFGLQFG